MIHPRWYDAEYWQKLRKRAEQEAECGKREKARHHAKAAGEARRQPKP